MKKQNIDQYFEWVKKNPPLKSIDEIHQIIDCSTPKNSLKSNWLKPLKLLIMTSTLLAIIIASVMIWPEGSNEIVGENTDIYQIENTDKEPYNSSPPTHLKAIIPYIHKKDTSIRTSQPLESTKHKINKNEKENIANQKASRSKAKKYQFSKPKSCFITFEDQRWPIFEIDLTSCNFKGTQSETTESQTSYVIWFRIPSQNNKLPKEGVYSLSPTSILHLYPMVYTGEVVTEDTIHTIKAGGFNLNYINDSIRIEYNIQLTTNEVIEGIYMGTFEDGKNLTMMNNLRQFLSKMKQKNSYSLIHNNSNHYKLHEFTFKQPELDNIPCDTARHISGNPFIVYLQSSEIENLGFKIDNHSVTYNNISPCGVINFSNIYNGKEYNHTPLSMLDISSTTVTENSFYPVFETNLFFDDVSEVCKIKEPFSLVNDTLLPVVIPMDEIGSRIKGNKNRVFWFTINDELINALPERYQSTARQINKYKSRRMEIAHVDLIIYNSNGFTTSTAIKFQAGINIIKEYITDSLPSKISLNPYSKTKRYSMKEYYYYLSEFSDTIKKQEGVLIKNAHPRFISSSNNANPTFHHFLNAVEDIDDYFPIRIVETFRKT